MALDIDGLETSFDLIAPCGDELTEIFYRRLFAAAPSVEPLFARTDMRRQKATLLATLVLLRRSLRDLDAIVPTLRQLGARHVGYGAKPEHYPVVGAVLIASMAEVAGDAWSTEFTSAWVQAYQVVADRMRFGAAGVRRRRAA